MHMDNPLYANAPAGQSVHSFCPTWLLNLPSGQSTHSLLSLNVRMGHGSDAETETQERLRHATARRRRRETLDIFLRGSTGGGGGYVDKAEVEEQKSELRKVESGSCFFSFLQQVWWAGTERGSRTFASFFVRKRVVTGIDRSTKRGECVLLVNLSLGVG